MIIADGLWGDAHNAADVTVIKTHLVEDNEEDVGGRSWESMSAGCGRKRGSRRPGRSR